MNSPYFNVGRLLRAEGLILRASQLHQEWLSAHADRLDEESEHRARVAAEQLSASHNALKGAIRSLDAIVTEREPEPKQDW